MKIRWVCKDCGSKKVRRGREGDKFPFGCPECGNKTLDRVKKVKLKDAVQAPAKPSAREPGSERITTDFRPPAVMETVTLEEAQKIFTGWWREGLLKAELKPKKVLKVFYVLREENIDEVRMKIVALCKLEGGETRRMAAKRYQRRSASKPDFWIVEPTKKPDGDELFSDTPIGRDAFARRLIAELKAGEERAKRWLLEHADKVKKAKGT